MRTETIEKTVYTYEELSDDAKEAARQWFRDALSGDEWWDTVYEDADAVASRLGVDFERKGRNTPCIWFSGFWSQGDGACFEGSYHYNKGAAAEVKAYAPKDTELHAIAEALQEAQRRNFYKLSATCSHTGRYFHSGSMSVSVDKCADFGEVSEEDEDAVTDALRSFADWIYARLEEEHEYLTSDETVAENIMANGYEFEEDGTLYRY